MAKVYTAPDDFKTPSLSFSKINEYQPAWDKYEADLKAWCIKRNPSEHVGEIISFPVADGSALYMVAALKPVELIHLEYLDGYSFQYANRLKASDITEKIEQGKRLNRIFGSKK